MIIKLYTTPYSAVRFIVTYSAVHYSILRAVLISFGIVMRFE